jgi:hypothetical protein
VEKQAALIKTDHYKVSSKQRFTTMAIVPAFNTREVELIIQSLPKRVDQRRLKLLPKILNEWVKTDLPLHLSTIPTKTRLARIKRLGKVSDCSRALLQALDTIEGNDEQFLIISEMVKGLRMLFPERLAERKKLETQFEEMRNFLGRISVAAAASANSWKQGRGHPRNIVAALVLMDIIAIYQWLTGKTVTRLVDRATYKDYGPFWHFAVAIWSRVFGSKKGLSATIKNWAEAVKQKIHRTWSPLIGNIAMRHPSWDISP